MNKVSKILVIISFIIIGMVLILNEPPTYSQPKDLVAKEVEYDIKSLQKDLLKEVDEICIEKSKNNELVRKLAKENKVLKKTLVRLIDERKKDTLVVKKDTIQINKDTIQTIKKRGFIKTLLNID